MQTKFSARPKGLSMSEIERLSGRSWGDLADLAFRCGWRGLPGEPIMVPLGTALNMLICLTAMSHGVEPGAMVKWLPGLRNEALLKLGEVIPNWWFDGPSDEKQRFLSMLYGSRDSVRPSLARLLGCCTSGAIRQLRFYSQSDVECLSNAQFELGHYSGRAPRFTIDAHELANRVQTICDAPLLIAKAAILA
jgi:hypothetical protein